MSDPAEYEIQKCTRDKNHDGPCNGWPCRCFCKCHNDVSVNKRPGGHCIHCDPERQDPPRPPRVISTDDVTEERKLLVCRHCFPAFTPLEIHIDWKAYWYVISCSRCHGAIIKFEYV